MIEPDFDMNGRMIGVSIVQPLTEDERNAWRRALDTWSKYPVIWTHGMPEVTVTQLCGRWEPDIEDTP